MWDKAMTIASGEKMPRKTEVTDRAGQLAVNLQVAVVVASYQGWRSDLPPPQNHCWEAGDTPQESP